MNRNDRTRIQHQHDQASAIASAVAAANACEHCAALSAEIQQLRARLDGVQNEAIGLIWAGFEVQMNQAILEGENNTLRNSVADLRARLVRYEPVNMAAVIAINDADYALGNL